MADRESSNTDVAAGPAVPGANVPKPGAKPDPKPVAPEMRIGGSMGFVTLPFRSKNVLQSYINLLQ